jgi:nicotinate phosphoribosyltransferase
MKGTSNMNEPILDSILDNDLYKFSMQQAVCQLYPKAYAKYEFINRGKTEFPEGFANALQNQILNMHNLSLSKGEKTFLQNKCYYLTPVYLDFLEGYMFDSSEIYIVQKGKELKITIEGAWYKAILWEVPLMALICELYYKMTGAPYEVQNSVSESGGKSVFFKEFGAKVSEFGTRRRFSKKNQDIVFQTLLKNAPNNITGTSNLQLAMKYNSTPIGTQAHEWFMFHASKYGYRMANQISLGRWVDVYHGNLGIALSDTFTTNAFFDSFDTMYGKLFDGVRHDSGDPFEFTDKVVEHYKNIRVDASTKTIVYSDGINSMEMVKNLKKYADEKNIRCAFGIGTWLSNDTGNKPLNIVIKMVAAKMNKEDNWIPTVKLSDAAGKNTGDSEEVKLCKQTLGVN